MYIRIDDNNLNLFQYSPHCNRKLQPNILSSKLRRTLTNSTCQFDRLAPTANERQLLALIAIIARTRWHSLPPLAPAENHNPTTHSGTQRTRKCDAYYCAGVWLQGLAYDKYMYLVSELITPGARSRRERVPHPVIVAPFDNLNGARTAEGVIVGNL